MTSSDFGQEVFTKISQGFILGPVLFPLYINDLSDDAICNIANYAVDTTLYSKCDQASALLRTARVEC